jgi:hypothetical protein
MLWSIHRTQRRRALNASQPQLVKLTKADAEMLCYGIGYFGGLETFSFQCPGPCSTLHRVRPRQRRRLFDSATQRFRCPRLRRRAAVVDPRGNPAIAPTTKRAAPEYEANLLQDFASRPPDTVPTLDQAVEIRRHGTK